MKTKLLLITCGLALTPVVHGADLLEVFEKAEQNDASYLAATYQRDIGGLQPRLAQSARNFNVTLNGSIGAQYESFDSGPNNNSDSYLSESISINASKTLYDKQSAIGVDKAVLADQQSSLVLQSAHEDLILRVANAYFQLLGAMDNLELATSEKIAIKRQLELAEERLNVGI